MKFDLLRETSVKYYKSFVMLKNLKGGILIMKRIITLFMMVFLLLGAFNIVLAEETSDVISNPREVGFFSNQMFKLGLIFTFNKEAKIDKILNMAERRLAEAELLEEKDPQSYNLVKERYDGLVAKAEKVLTGVKAEDENENVSIEYLGKIARIENKFERHRDHINDIYAYNRERFEANNASEEKIKRFRLFYNRTITRSDMMENRLIEKRNNAILKHKALTKMSDDKLETFIKGIDNEVGLTKAREYRILKSEKRIKKLAGIGAEELKRSDRKFKRWYFPKKGSGDLGDVISNKSKGKKSIFYNKTNYGLKDTPVEE